MSAEKKKVLNMGKFLPAESRNLKSHLKKNYRWMRILKKPLKFVDGHGAGRFFGSQAIKAKNTKSGFWERGNGLLHILVALTLMFILSYYDSEILFAAETMYPNLYYLGYK